MNEDKLIEDNMKLVYYVINKYYPTYMYDEDVIQEGMLGLCQAANTYDSSKTKFSTYAFHCIRNRLKYYLRCQSKHSGLLSLDFDVKCDDGNGGDSFIDFIVGEHDISTVGIDFETFYSTLNESEKELLDLSFHYSNTEIAQLLGTTQTNISTKKWKLRKKWRKFIGNY